MHHFKVYSKQDILSLVKLRRYETKLGEQVLSVMDTTQWETSLAQSPATYVVLGIPEDIGVKANGSVGGADTSWIPFLQAFLNIQSNDFLIGNQILLLGHFDFGDVQYAIENNALSTDERLEAYRHAVNIIDDEVEKVINLITAAKKIPLVVGGGHNNTYPLIKGSAKGWSKAGMIPFPKINAINVDAHTDYRPLEGRHSGNAFRYAEEDGYLVKYCAVGVQENYIPQNVWMDIVNNPFVDLITYEDIFVREKRNFIQALAHALEFTEDSYVGLDLDLDIIENALASAQTPSGISVQQARQYMGFAANRANVAYVHLSEGASRLSDGRASDQTGKLLSYLATDFIKSHLDRDM